MNASSEYCNLVTHWRMRFSASLIPDNEVSINTLAVPHFSIGFVKTKENVKNSVQDRSRIMDDHRAGWYLAVSAVGDI